MVSLLILPKDNIVVLWSGKSWNKYAELRIMELSRFRFVMISLWSNLKWIDGLLRSWELTKDDTTYFCWRRKVCGLILSIIIVLELFSTESLSLELCRFINYKYFSELQYVCTICIWNVGKQVPFVHQCCKPYEWSITAYKIKPNVQSRKLDSNDSHCNPHEKNVDTWKIANSRLSLWVRNVTPIFITVWYSNCDLQLYKSVFPDFCDVVTSRLLFQWRQQQSVGLSNLKKKHKKVSYPSITTPGSILSSPAVSTNKCPNKNSNLSHKIFVICWSILFPCFQVHLAELKIILQNQFQSNFRNCHLTRQALYIASF